MFNVVVARPIMWGAKNVFLSVSTDRNLRSDPPSCSILTSSIPWAPGRSRSRSLSSCDAMVRCRAAGRAKGDSKTGCTDMNGVMKWSMIISCGSSTSKHWMLTSRRSQRWPWGIYTDTPPNDPIESDPPSRCTRKLVSAMDKNRCLVPSRRYVTWWNRRR